jgi:ribonuclease HI
VPEWTVTLAISARPPQAGFAWRVVRPDGTSADGTGVDPGASAWRVRLLGAASALAAVPDGVPIAFQAGDATLAQIAQEWMPRWRAAGWKKDKGVIEDVDAVRRFDAALTGRQVTWLAGDKRSAAYKAVEAQAQAARDLCPPDGPRQSAVPVALPNDVELVGWTDGGCRKNPGPGGWGFVLVHVRTGVTLQRRGGAPDTTNNRMELQALLELLAAVQREGTTIEVHADSKYVIQTCEEWMPSWKRKGWTRGRDQDGNVQEVKNLDLVKALDAALVRQKVRFVWTRGHAGDPGNERADALCNEAMDAVQRGQDPAWTGRADAPPFPIERRGPQGA